MEDNIRKLFIEEIHSEQKYLDEGYFKVFVFTLILFFQSVCEKTNIEEKKAISYQI